MGTILMWLFSIVVIIMLLVFVGFIALNELVPTNKQESIKELIYEKIVKWISK